MTNIERQPEAGALGLTGFSPILIATRWLEQYARMKRWHSRITESQSVDAHAVDDVYAFFVCCYHLKDWIKNDDSVEKTIRDEVETTVSASPMLSLSGDITNGFKHLKLNKARVDASAHVETIGTPLGEFTLDDSRLGGIVVAGAQAPLDAKVVAQQCQEAWDAFLRARGMSSGSEPQ